MRQHSEARAGTIIDVVLELLESEGYEAVQVRAVASRARVSLATRATSSSSRRCSDGWTPMPMPN